MTTVAVPTTYAEAEQSLREFMGCKITDGPERSARFAAQVRGYIAEMLAAGRPSPARDICEDALRGIAGLLEIGGVDAVIAHVRAGEFAAAGEVIEQNVSLHEMCSNYAKADCIAHVGSFVHALGEV